MTFDFCSNDNSFGPVSQCRTFDFTIYFEQAILSILPAAILLAIAIPSIAVLIRRRRCVHRMSTLFTVKLVSILVNVSQMNFNSTGSEHCLSRSCHRSYFRSTYCALSRSNSLASRCRSYCHRGSDNLRAKYDTTSAFHQAKHNHVLVSFYHNTMRYRSTEDTHLHCAYSISGGTSQH